MASAATAGWWERTRARLRADDGTDHFAPDRLDAHARALQSALPLFLALLIAFPVNLFMDGDTGWHLGAGHWIVANRTVPLVDPFSHTMPGKAWMAHEWLAEVVMVGAEWLRGWGGLAALFALSAAFTFWLLAREAFRFLPARLAVVAVAVAAGILFPFALARPHMLAWSLLAWWTLILLRAREARAAPPLAAALLMAVWANLHASYIVAFGLAGLFGLESLIENPRNRKLLGRWIAFGALSLAIAVLATPFGAEHFLYPFQVSGMKALSVIGEWRRSTLPADFLFYTCLGGLLLLAAKRWRTLPPLRVLLLAGLSVMAILHARHQMLFAIVGLLVVLPLLQPSRTPRPALKRTAWMVPALTLLIAVRLAVPYQFQEHSTYPLSLLAKVPEEIRRQPVYNEYSQGGPLVMIGVRPYIDGRADMYGDDFTFRAKAITAGDIAKFREDAARYHIGWVVLEYDDALLPKLKREPGWRVFAEDRNATIFVRANS
ncbi:hypothetical protein [Sphingomonas astaxanthinifaciens]|uniref:Glycosyltransferase RgtA/B/C/D-like domain-containing protein n=1 Tax=Sphingomonas astaxanthinifaciens DSM 22298 TaxID=1123267 RepID=A0ABQ5Z9A5_9SPHN|nr:hypothetical protein [Sphingomonas astaxanthinifaciens]GLR47448.1 hypothetical protein GCM10007925_11600 [Sphingomonas astaxanthinifaciens DSM 22298]